MKTILLIILMTICLPLFASTFTIQGTVHTLRDHADDLLGEDTDYLLLNGVAVAGNCKTTEGLVVVRIPSAAERSFSIALAAQTAGRELKVSIDDSRVDSGGYCIFRWLNIVD